MADFVKRVARRPESLHPVVFAAPSPYSAGGYPSVYGWERAGLPSGCLLRDAYPPASYPATSQVEYLTTLERAQITGDVDPFVQVTAEAVDWMQQRYLLAIRQTWDPSPRFSLGFKVHAIRYWSAGAIRIALTWATCPFSRRIFFARR